MLEDSQARSGKMFFLREICVEKIIAIEYCKNMDQKVLQYDMQYVRVNTKVLQYV